MSNVVNGLIRVSITYTQRSRDDTTHVTQEFDIFTRNFVNSFFLFSHYPVDEQVFRLHSSTYLLVYHKYECIRNEEARVIHSRNDWIVNGKPQKKNFFLTYRIVRKRYTQCIKYTHVYEKESSKFRQHIEYGFINIVRRRDRVLMYILLKRVRCVCV